MRTLRFKITDLYQFEGQTPVNLVTSVTELTPLVLKQFAFLPQPLVIMVEGDEVVLQFPEESNAAQTEATRLAQKGAKRAAEGDYAKAIGIFKRVLELQPSLHSARRDLAKWHLNYEAVEPYPVSELKSELTLDPSKHFIVQKMVYGRKDKQVDKTTIHYNSHLTLTGIPLETYDCIVNGKSAIDWIMERYQVTCDKDSGITNDPNDWAKEHNQPRYIVDLLKSVITVSIETMKIVNSLPPLNERVNG
ncbi:hypothetical protein BH11VER1_BH11VER1_04700 [soil metagenome]